MKLFTVTLLICLTMLYACSDSSDNNADIATPTNLQVTNAFPNLLFNRPVDMAQVPDSNHIVVVEHTGIIKIFENKEDTNNSSIFLDITERTEYNGNELGLVNIEFDPDYANNGYFYVAYAMADIYPDDASCRDNPCFSTVARFQRSEQNPLIADPDSEASVLRIPRVAIHNPNNLVFGPDNFLYIGIGDGGNIADNFNRAQNRTNLNGSILRIDVSQGLPYRIPEDNPFVEETLEREGVVGAGQPVKHEIWAYGLRNPHRFSIDPVTGEMLGGDVGLASKEELNLYTAGGNYGWRVYEGSSLHDSEDNGRQDSEFTEPLLEYDHSTGSSIIGGHVYRGAEFPGLFGKYVYGDFTAGKIWALAKKEDQSIVENTLIASLNPFGLVSFGVIDNELYLVNISQGIIQKINSPE